MTPTLRGIRRVQVTPELVTALLKHGSHGFDSISDVPRDLELEDVTLSRLRGGSKLINLFVSSASFTTDDEIKAYTSHHAAPVWEIKIRTRPAA